MIVAGHEAKLTSYYTYRDGALYRNVTAGQFLEAKRPTRNAGNFKVYTDSFPNASLPYSVYKIADIRTGDVYTFELIHGMGTSLKDVVEELKTK